MKKIGIITFHRVNNYGALLQAYALKHVLLKQGNMAHILNYECPKLKNDYTLFPRFEMNLHWVIKQAKHILLFPLENQFRSHFLKFGNQYLNDTALLTPATISQVTADYDLFIAGSDQVFNPRITGFDSNFFLSFSSDKSKNYSYAASFGLSLENLTEKEHAFMKEHLSHFNRLSTRETQGEKIVKTLTNQEATISIDPTLLLTKTDWEEIAVPPKLKENYVLLYAMHKDKSLIAFAKQLAKETQCQLIYLSPQLDIRNRVPAKHITPTPQGWLGLFLNASYVVTNSFHGLAFSINLNKNFFLGKLPSKLSVNSRFDNLLNLTGLQGRLYTNFTNKKYDSSIDWSLVNAKLDQERRKSLVYLQEITK